MTEYELLSLIRESVAAINQDFEFFLAATFAVIVASYTAGERLTQLPRIIIAILYLMAAVLFYLRYLAIGEQAGYYFQMLKEINSAFPQPDRAIHSILRKLIMVLGSLSAIVMLFRPEILNRNNDTIDHQ